MSDVENESEATTEVEPEAAKADEGAKPDEALGEPGRRALAAERTARAAAEKELKELKDRDKTEAERAAERLVEAEKRAEDVEARANRAEVAVTTGIPVDVLAGPKSPSADDIKAFAEVVTAYVTEASKKNPNGPVIPGQGKQPDKPAPENADDWLRAMARA